MVFLVTMPQGRDTNTKGKSQQQQFKKGVVNQVHPKKRQAADEQRHQGAMDGTGNRCRNTQPFPIDSKIHSRRQRYFICNGVAKDSIERWFTPKGFVPLQPICYMSKKLWFYLIFFVFLLGFFYLALFWGTDLWRKKLPTLNDVKPFAFISQNGDTITHEQVAGKVYVAEFFFTTCKGICPKMNRNMANIATDFKDEPDFVILSHTVNPETDSVPTMKRYADSLKANPNKWFFLTGSKKDLYEAARRSYLLDDPNNSVQKLEEQFIHTQFFALVDKKGGVRGIYDGLEKKELEKLYQDIRLLLKETYNGPRFVNGIFQNSPN